MSSKNEKQVTTGISGAVIDKGPMGNLIPYVLQGVRHGMQDLGYRNMTELHRGLYTGEMRMECRSAAAQKEGAVHDLKSHRGDGGSYNKVVSLNNRWS